MTQIDLLFLTLLLGFMPIITVILTFRTTRHLIERQRVAVMLLVSILNGMAAFFIIQEVSRRTRVIERKAEEIQRMRHECPCAKDVYSMEQEP